MEYWSFIRFGCLVRWWVKLKNPCNSYEWWALAVLQFCYIREVIFWHEARINGIWTQFNLVGVNFAYSIILSRSFTNLLLKTLLVYLRLKYNMFLLDERKDDLDLWQYYWTKNAYHYHSLSSKIFNWYAHYVPIYIVFPLFAWNQMYFYSISIFTHQSIWHWIAAFQWKHVYSHKWDHKTGQYSSV